ncbi:hypothetical protein E8E13_010539 [Curvularia kusanoi]|uniref:Heterokaryon incompatibility domain-containing protein n=1 Tax=Curvularia kusanoi TaxID=90978 RepID=A0A9P4TJG5_CURKU|nr:hypothetical protein E8E13_010539 [Curvularia kusanoi]
MCNPNPCLCISVGIDSSLEPSKTPRLYEELPHDDSIRLLRIYRGTPEDTIEVTLELVQLNDANLEYEALSYAWGSNLKVSQITHKSTQTPIQVTKNLYDALKGLRRIDRDRAIWVDALCINQQDLLEKSAQVRQMNKLYARASQVVVWLGPDDAGDADGAFYMLRTLADARDVTPHPAGRVTQHMPVDSGKLVPFNQNIKICRKVMEFFFQPWFSRLWVLQEIALAQDAIFVWGEKSISWKDVGLAMETIEESIEFSMMFDHRHRQNAFRMWRMSNVYQTYCLIHLLDLARTFEVTNPLDKIFALLGFPGEDDSTVAPSLDPDYTLSTCQIYTRATLFLLKSDKNLQVLSLVLNKHSEHADANPQTCQLPSWVPDLTSTACSFSNANIGHEYTAGCSQPIHLGSSDPDGTLRLGGVLMDTIEAVGPNTPYVDLDKAAPYYRARIEWCLDKAVSVNTLAMTLTAGRDKNGYLLSQQQKPGYITALYSLIHRNFEPETSRPPSEPDSTSHPGDPELTKSMHHYMAYRQPFITQTGRLGLGPHGLSQGDRVAVLWGGQCPFVVSTTGDGQWTLKGECFIQDWMEGEEVAKQARETGAKDAIFVFV